MGFPDRIERTVELAHPPVKVWAALTTAEGLAAWFGNEAAIDLRPGGSAWMKWNEGHTAEMRGNGEEPRAFGFTWHIYGLPEGDPRRTYVEFTLEPDGAGTRLTVVESGFAQLSRRGPPPGVRRQHRGRRASWANWPPTSTPPDIEAVAEQVFVALADPTRRAILAALAVGGPAMATRPGGPPAHHPAGDRQAPGPADTGLRGHGRAGRAAPGAVPEPCLALMQAAQQFLAALARDWDSPLGALKDHLDWDARGPALRARCTEPPGTLTRKAGTTMKTPPIAGPQEWEAARERRPGEGEGTDPCPGCAGGRAVADAVAGRVQGVRVRRAAGQRRACLYLFEGRRQLVVYRAFFEPGVYGWPGHACPAVLDG